MTRITRPVTSLIAAEDGAVAPLVALSIFGLVGAGVLAFDYSRMVAMDTELQNAADQAALAAATQLQDNGTCDLPTQAARELVANRTQLASDGVPLITVPSVVCAPNEVTVTVQQRRVQFSLMDMDQEGTASARASLASAICKVPPLIMCNPGETTLNSDFNVPNHVGRGILVKAGGGGAWAPGNFGFLQIGGEPSAKNLSEAFGKTDLQYECVKATGVSTAPGNMSAVSKAINTRFDIYDECDGADCPPSVNVVKDVVRTSGATAKKCGFKNGWELVPEKDRYWPVRDPANPKIGTDSDGVTSMGHPRDMCHAVATDQNDVGTCGGAGGGIIGDGNWDRDTYFKVNHGYATTTDWQAAVGKLAPTRYETYVWEIENSKLNARPVGSNTSYKAPTCGAPGINPIGSAVDRRKTSVAVVNCKSQSINGNTPNVKVLKWIDVFLVEPSIDRHNTKADQIYIEIVGETQTAGNGEQGQLIRRDVPFLTE
jgi:hypothetical protein